MDLNDSRTNGERGRFCSWRDATTQKGCGNRVGLMPSAGAGGALRCSWHDPDRRGGMLAARRAKEAEAGKPRTVDAGELPVSEILTMDDAEKLARWVPIAIATGRIGGREAQAMVGALREYRMTVADAGLVARFEALEARIKDARKRGLDV